MTNTYDRLIANPPPECYDIGTQDGETCGRYLEPDEDAPRGYKPKPCNGTMHLAMQKVNFEPLIECDTCGEIA